MEHRIHADWLFAKRHVECRDLIFGEVLGTFAFLSVYSPGDGQKLNVVRVGDMYVFHDEDAIEDLLQDVGLVATSASWKV